MVRIAVFGRTGQVATELSRRKPVGVSLLAIDREAADFAHPEQVVAIARELNADAVINAVAYTAVDRAESEPDLAHAVNAASVGALAGICRDRNLPLVHVSTDYVFDGSGDAPRAPDAPIGPLGIYGATKLAGEDAIRAAGGAHAILRTSWVFSAHGQNFVKTMLRLSETRDRLTIVADQVGGPTPAADIADTLFVMARGLVAGQAGGTYHYSGAPDVSWADFAREIFAQAHRRTEVADIPTTDYPTPATRPLNSRLDCRALEAEFGISRPDWRAGLADVLKEIT